MASAKIASAEQTREDPNKVPSNQRSDSVDAPPRVPSGHVTEGGASRPNPEVTQRSLAYTNACLEARWA